MVWYNNYDTVKTTMATTTLLTAYTSQSTYIYRAPQCMSPCRNWDSPTPLAAGECSLPPDQRVGGHTSLRLKGWGSPNSDDWRKSLALCLLCAIPTPAYFAEPEISAHRKLTIYAEKLNICNNCILGEFIKHCRTKYYLVKHVLRQEARHCYERNMEKANYRKMRRILYIFAI